MIITRCPYRVSFFGGGTDFPNWYKKNGCNIISCSIDGFCYVTIRKLLPFYGNNYRVSWSEIEEVNNINSIKHPAIKGALSHLEINNGLEIHTDGDLPGESEELIMPMIDEAGKAINDLSNQLQEMSNSK